MQIPVLYSNYCQILKETGCYRFLSHNAHGHIDFSTNDYLGLSKHPQVIEQAQLFASRYGTGGTASRLVQREQDCYLALEEKIADSKKTEAALIFNSGYQANITVLAALLDKKVLQAEPLVFTDRLNHASLHQGCELAGVRQIRYQHLDCVHLESLLQTHAKSSAPKFIITESVFGMDGDCADLGALSLLAERHQAFLYVDEAHATGVLGTTGYGLSVDYSGIHLKMGTLSKALGSSGGYVASSRKICDYLVNKGRGFIYSTAPSPMSVGAATAAWELIPTLSQERVRLHQMANWLREQLRDRSLDVGQSQTQIIPVILGDEERVMKVKTKLAERGLFVAAIRPPSVPQKTARLRLSLTTLHTEDNLKALLKGLDECL